MQRVMVFLMVGIVLVSVVLLASDRTNAADGKPAPVEVKIDNFSFGPASLTVPVGTEITWTNNDDIPHTVTSEDKTTFKSHALDTNEKFTFKFDKSGTYTYFCSIHPKMTAKVVVQ